MYIKQRRIRELRHHFGFVQRGREIVVGLKAVHQHIKVLKMAGFNSELGAGETLLPAPVFGPVSRFNANGKELVHKNRPMETAYRQAEWHWTEWHGRDRVERSDTVDIPYRRYPRSFVSPPSIELQVAVTRVGETIIVSSPIVYTEDQTELIVHTINLFLEMFGECFVLDRNLETIVRAPVRRLNWHVLPPGRWPWSELKTHVKPIIERAPKGNQSLIEYRFETINQYGPEFVAVGRAGFRGYVIFGFPDKGIYALESAYFGNATYVFGEDWETLSQMTKAEILNASLHLDRIIHRDGWQQHLRRLLARSLQVPT